MVRLIQQNIEEKEMTKETDKRAETKRKETKTLGIKKTLEIIIIQFIKILRTAFIWHKNQTNKYVIGA
jgi:hypothetical protein